MFSVDICTKISLSSKPEEGFCFGGSRKEVQMKVIHFLIPFYHCDDSMLLLPQRKVVANDSEDTKSVLIKEYVNV